VPESNSLKNYNGRSGAPSGIENGGPDIGSYLVAIEIRLNLDQADDLSRELLQGSWDIRERRFNVQGSDGRGQVGSLGINPLLRPPEKLLFPEDRWVLGAILKRGSIVKLPPIRAEFGSKFEDVWEAGVLGITCHDISDQAF
jgi:hypothetical protein